MLELLTAEGAVPFSYVIFAGSFSTSTLKFKLPKNIPSSNNTFLRALFELKDGSATTVDSDLFSLVGNIDTGGTFRINSAFSAFMTFRL
jgi:hypothetical protein